MEAGNLWAGPHRPRSDDADLLQASGALVLVGHVLQSSPLLHTLTLLSERPPSLCQRFCQRHLKAAGTRHKNLFLCFSPDCYCCCLKFRWTKGGPMDTSGAATIDYFSHQVFYPLFWQIMGSETYCTRRNFIYLTKCTENVLALLNTLKIISNKCGAIERTFRI